MIGNTRRMNWLGCLAMVAVCGLASSSCGDAEEQAAGMYGEPCAAGATPCASGLMCVQGLCTVACTDRAPCLPFSSTAICEGYCYEPCATTSQCMVAGLQCRQVISTQGTCRAQ